MRKEQVKGIMRKAWIVLIIALLGCNSALLLSMQMREKAREERFERALEQERVALEKALAVREEKIREAIAVSESNITAVLRRIERTEVGLGRVRSATVRQSSAGEKDTGNAIHLLYDEAYLEDREEEGWRLLKEKAYGAAYKVYDEIVKRDPERLSSRYYRIYSLFYSNEMNREKYDDIVKEIEYLRGKGMEEESFKEIEKFIERERGIGDEGR